MKTGFFGTKESFVPLRDATKEGEDIVVDCDKETVKDAPRIETDEDLTPQDEEVLYRHYGLGTAGPGRPQEPRHPGEAPETADEAMTVSEERLRVGKEQREAGRMRLRKYVVTETVTQTVPVTHEGVWLTNWQVLAKGQVWLPRSSPSGASPRRVRWPLPRWPGRRWPP